MLVKTRTWEQCSHMLAGKARGEWQIDPILPTYDQKTPWGGGKRRGEENLTNDTPPKKGFWTPPIVRYVFHPPQVSVLCFFPVQNPRQSRTEAFLEGSKSRSLVRSRPFRTKKNTTVPESVVFCYRRSFSLSVLFSCLLCLEKQAFRSPLRSVLFATSVPNLLPAPKFPLRSVFTTGGSLEYPQFVPRSPKFMKATNGLELFFLRLSLFLEGCLTPKKLQNFPVGLLKCLT